MVIKLCCIIYLGLNDKSKKLSTEEDETDGREEKEEEKGQIDKNGENGQLAEDREKRHNDNNGENGHKDSKVRCQQKESEENSQNDNNAIVQQAEKGENGQTSQHEEERGNDLVDRVDQYGEKEGEKEQIILKDGKNAHRTYQEKKFEHVLFTFLQEPSKSTVSNTGCPIILARVAHLFGQGYYGKPCFTLATVIRCVAFL